MKCICNDLVTCDYHRRIEFEKEFKKPLFEKTQKIIDTVLNWKDIRKDSKLTDEQRFETDKLVKEELLKMEKKMTLKPLGSFILVQPCEEKEMTEGGLYIVETAREKDGTAIVRAVGNGVEFPDGTMRQLRVRVGDKVIYDKFAGVKTKVDGKEMLFLREQDCYAVISE